MYKILQNNKIIDIVRYPQFIRFLASGHIAITDKTSANGIVGSDSTTIYSFSQRAKYQTVTIEEITLEEFERLQGLLNSDKEICADDSALAKAKQNKIKHQTKKKQKNCCEKLSNILIINFIKIIFSKVKTRPLSFFIIIFALCEIKLTIADIFKHNMVNLRRILWQ